jgi:hypothetical protein
MRLRKNSWDVCPLCAVVTTMIKPLMTKNKSTPLLPNTVTPCGNPAILDNTSK